MTARAVHLPARKVRTNPIRAKRARSPLSMEIMQRVIELRRAKGMTQNDIEAAADLARGSVNALESGKRGRMLSVDVVLRLAEALGEDVGELITGKKKR